MDDEIALLRGILVKPDDTARRLNYADWLEERRDPRARFLRMAPDLERISYVAWLELDGELDWYIQNFPEVKREAEERQASAQLRDQRRALGSQLDPNWVAFLNTMGCAFQPFFFFNNSGGPRECQPDELPFAVPIGTRGSLIAFESDFQKERDWDQGLMRDLGFLTQLELGDCYNGAARCPVHPFICELKTEQRPLCESDILESLRPLAFNPLGDARGGQIDQIHSDFDSQYIFAHNEEDIFEYGPIVEDLSDSINENEEDVSEYGHTGDNLFDPTNGDDEEEVDEFSGTHGVLKRFVVD